MSDRVEACLSMRPTAERMESKICRSSTGYGPDATFSHRSRWMLQSRCWGSCSHSRLRVDDAEREHEQSQARADRQRPGTTRSSAQ